MPIICNNCGQNVPDDSTFCPKCGAKITIVRCADCGAVLAADARFCPSCGTPVGSSVVPTELDTHKEQIPQDAKVREDSVKRKPDFGRATQPGSDQTAVVDTPKRPQSRFDWKYWSVSILRGYGTTRNTVEIADEAVVITSKLNEWAIYDAVTVPLKNIASVEVWEKVSVISSLMAAVLVGLFAGLIVLVPFGVTAIDPYTAEGIGSMVGITILTALVIWAGFFRMHHWRITIKTHKNRNT